MSNPSAVPNFGCTCARLRKLARRLTRIYDAHLSAQGIKVTQYSLLAHAARGARALWRRAQHEVESTLGNAFVGKLHGEIDHALRTLSSEISRGRAA